MNDLQTTTLTFDCYGTLIDWEEGIWRQLEPFVGHLADRDSTLARYGEIESEIEQDRPRELYSSVLRRVFRRLCAEYQVPVNDDAVVEFGASVEHWPPFTDTVEALGRLARHFRLVILSNVDDHSFAGSEARLQTPFDAVYTAQAIGSYKPDPRNFDHLLEHERRSGIEPEQILHVAQSLFHDHVPALAAGLRTCWVDRRRGRGGGATPPASGVRPTYRVETLAELADAVDSGQLPPRG